MIGKLQKRADVNSESWVKSYRSMAKGSFALYEKGCKVIPDGSTRRSVFFPPYPLYIARGDGCKIYDVDGREFIDYTSNYGPLILGHKHSKVVKAIHDQLQNGTALGGPTELEVRLAGEIVKSLPGSHQVMFCASGTEANMIGVRLLRAQTGKEKILMCDGAYHGTSDSFVSGQGIPKDVAARIITVPFNDIDKFEVAIKKHKDKLAAVFMEPIMRGIPPKPNYLKQVREITKQYGILLAFDEVVTGFRLSRGGPKGSGESDLT